jgi:hypothetical protein
LGEKFTFEVNGEPLFILIPPKLSSKYDEGDCSPHGLRGDFTWVGILEGWKGEGASFPWWGKNEVPVWEICYRQVISAMVAKQVEGSYIYISYRRSRLSFHRARGAPKT